MHWIDWLIVIIPLVIVGIVAFKTQRYVTGVSDFLVAGRVANRYVVAVAGLAATMGLISAVGLFEMYYKSGFALRFWDLMLEPIIMIITLTGFAVYRFRETRAMTLGQFFEIRYSKHFRIFTGVLQSISGIVNYALFPAVGARFVVYFCDLPANIYLFGMHWPTFGFVMAFFLGLAVVITTMGGQITIMATDCIQGILSYPMYLIVVVAIMVKFSWQGQMAPTLLDRPAGQSMLNPFDLGELSDFNLFYIVVGMIWFIYSTLSWSGIQGYNAAAYSAHEQKMGKVLGVWRYGFSWTIYILIAAAAYTYMNHGDFSAVAADTRHGLIAKTMSDVVPGEEFDTVREEIQEYNRTGQISTGLQDRLDIVRAEDALDAEAQGKTPEEIEDILHPKDPAANTIARTALKSVDKSKAQVFDTIFRQMRVPVAVRDIFPVGVVGVFCAIMIFLMISTDTTYLHSWGSILVQDIFLPFRKKPFTPRQQLRWLRIGIACVAVFAFFFSLFFGQITYILMWFHITGALWTGGAGIVILGGLYWKRGTTAGAWLGLCLGSILAVFGFLGTKCWVGWIYPMLQRSPAVLLWVTKIVEGISEPFRPYVNWRVTPDKFPINGMELMFITMGTAILSYVVVSLLTCRKPFNMDRMLHRGKYHREGDKKPDRVSLRSPKAILRALMGIDSQFTRGDKILSWSVFLYQVLWIFGSWLVITLWDRLKEGHWPAKWWATWFSIQYLIVFSIIGLVSTVWFSIGGIHGLRLMFKRLATQQADVLDDGRVIGNVSADDVSLVEEVEHTRIAEAHEDEEGS